MHGLYQALLSQYQIDPVLLPQVQEMMSQVLQRLSQDHGQEEKRLKLRLAELKKKHETLERRYAYGEIEREILTKFSNELKTEVREIEVNLGKIAGPLSNHLRQLVFGLAAGISQKMGEKKEGRAALKLTFPS